MSRMKPNLTVLVLAALLAAPVQAQTPAPAPAPAPVPAPEAPAPVPAPEAPVPVPAPVPAPEAPAPAPVPPPPPQLSPSEFSPLPPRVVLLVPQKRAVRLRPKRKYGDAGAPIAVGMGLTLAWPSDSGYGLAGLDEPQRRFELFAAYDVWQPTERVVISAGANFRTLLGGAGERAEIHERTLLGELTARYTATPWLFPHLRVAAGSVQTRVSIEDEQLASDGDRGVSFEDQNWAAAGSIGAGFTLRTKARTFETYSGHVSSLSFGLLVEGGYTLAPAMKVTLDPEGTPSSGVKLTTASPGSLDRSAPYLRLAAVARF